MADLVTGEDLVDGGQVPLDPELVNQPADQGLVLFCGHEMISLLK